MARSPRRDQKPEGIYVLQKFPDRAPQLLHFYYETRCFYFGKYGRLSKQSKHYQLEVITHAINPILG